MGWLSKGLGAAGAVLGITGGAAVAGPAGGAVGGVAGGAAGSKAAKYVNRGADWLKRKAGLGKKGDRCTAGRIFKSPFTGMMITCYATNKTRQATPEEIKFHQDNPNTLHPAFAQGPPPIANVIVGQLPAEEKASALLLLYGLLVAVLGFVVIVILRK